MITVYEHDGKEIYRDEASEYEIEDIRAHYAQFDQRLVTATYTVVLPEKEGEPRKVIFAKKAGTKGGGEVPGGGFAEPTKSQGEATHWPGEAKAPYGLIAALLTTPPAVPAAFALLVELTKGPALSVEELLILAPEIEAAQGECEGLASRSHLAVERCMAIRPAPAPVPPVGF